MLMPYWIGFLLGSAAAALLLALPMLKRFARAWGRPWQLKRPLSGKALAIQGDVFVAPRALQEARLPFEPASQPRLRSGALLWASAATVTHTLAAAEDQQAILAAVKPLGFTPDKFLARCPVLGEVEHLGQQGCVVRDGSSWRAYFLGDPAALMAACQSVWDQQERALTPEDAQALPPSGPGVYGLAMAPATDEGVGPLTYLGSMHIASPLRGTEAINLLTQQGFAVHITPCGDPAGAASLQRLGHGDLPPAAALHVGLEAAEGNCFVIDDPDDASWAERLIAGFRLAQRQRRTLLLAGFALVCLLCAAAVWRVPGWLLPLGALLLLPRCLSGTAKTVHSAKLHLPAALAWSAGCAVLLSLFARFAAPEAAHLALPLAWIASSLLLGADRSLRRLLPVLALGPPALIALWLLNQPPALLGVFCLVAGLLQGLVLRLILERICSYFSETYS